MNMRRSHFDSILSALFDTQNQHIEELKINYSETWSISSDKKPNVDVDQHVIKFLLDPYLVNGKVLHGHMQENLANFIAHPEKLLSALEQFPEYTHLMQEAKRRFSQEKNTKPTKFSPDESLILPIHFCHGRPENPFYLNCAHTHDGQVMLNVTQDGTLGSAHSHHHQDGHLK